MESHVLEVKQSLYARLRQSELMWCKISTSYRNRKHHWLLLICCCCWCSSRLLHGNLTLGKIEQKAFSCKTPRADRTVIVFYKQMDTKITQVNSHYTKCHRSGQLTKSTSWNNIFFRLRAARVGHEDPKRSKSWFKIDETGSHETGAQGRKRESRLSWLSWQTWGTLCFLLNNEFWYRKKTPYQQIK